MTATLVVVASIAIAYMSTVWRLPDLKRLPPLGHTFAGVQFWDLIGTSACAGTNLLPPAYKGEGALSVDELRAIYDPRHVDLTMLRRDGIKPLPKPAEYPSAELSQAWHAAIRDYPLCFLHHRQEVFEYQMGLADHIFIPTHSGIDKNDYGISFLYPEAAAQRIKFIESGADTWLRRPFWLYFVAAITTLVVINSRKQSAPVVFTLWLGAVLYVATFIFLAPAADARYIFPSNIFCALAAAIALASLVSWRRLNADNEA